MLAADIPVWAAAGGAVVAGFASGVLSAMMGIGGAVVTTPAVRVLGATPIEAVGSTVPAIMPGAISGAWRYTRERMVEWRLAVSLGVSGSVFAVVGALTSAVVNGRVLMVLTAALMLWAGTTVLRGLRSTGHDGADPGVRQGDRPRDSVPLLVLVGGFAGFTAGLLGVGGGIVLVPVLTGILKVPMRRAVASSLVAVAIFQVPTVVSHIALGHVNWLFALPLMVGAVPGAQLGAHLTVGASDRTIRAFFGALIVALAVLYGVTEVRGLVMEGL